MSSMRFDHRTFVATLAVTARVACKPSDRGTPTDTAAPAAAAAPGTDSAMRRDSAGGMVHDSVGGSAAANVSHGGWTDAQIVAFAAAASDDEIADGNLAAKKATNAEVKSFAREMVRDHEKLRSDGRAFAKEHNITPDTTKGDVEGLIKDSRDDLKDLADKEAGADWDKAFLDETIDDHQGALKKLQDAAEGTTNTALRDLITKQTGKVQEHLTKAKALKEKLGG